MRNNLIIILTILILSSIVISCENENYIPKPRGYFRIALPEKKYKTFDTIYPYTFEYPDYSEIVPDVNRNTEPYWINIEFPSFKGILHLSYKPVTSDSILYRYFEDARTFVNKHIAKADDIEPIIIKNDQNQVYGLIYDITGSGVASTYQFCVTDSTKNYLRGALYFNIMPNNDSMSPVINFIKADIDHFIQTLKWKKI